jgi:hypothetical protein
MANTTYPNHVLAHEVEDQYNSHLDLMTFCTVDNSLVGTPGMKKKIVVYSATNGTEKLAKGAGNTKSIEATHTTKEFEILLAQNRFDYFDEEQMEDPLCVQTGMRHAGVDLFNTVNEDIFAEFNKATKTINAAAINFDAFVDAVAGMGLEKLEGVEVFAFVANEDMASLRKTLKDDLKYVEAFVRGGYVGTVAGVNLYIKKDAVPGTIVGGTKAAVTLFNKKGIEVEQEREGNIRKNTIYTRKFYLPALTDETKAFKIVKT